MTLRAVARRVGIAAPSIYRHFADQPSIMLAVVQQAFDDLDAELRGALDARRRRPPDAAVRRLHRLPGVRAQASRALPHDVRRPLDADLEATSLTEADLHALGQGSMQLLVEVLGGCVAAGIATSTDLSADAVALWVGLHGLAHQQSVTVAFPWPPDITERLIVALAHLTDG